jgi:hypothetical protein
MIRADPERVDYWRARLTERTDRDSSCCSYAHGWMTCTVRRIAQLHGAECPGCPTCAELSEALAFALAFQLTDLPSETLLQIHPRDAGGE